VFQAALCLILFNVPQLVRAYITAGRSDPAAVEDVSAEQIFADMTRDLIGLHEVLTLDEVTAGLPVPGGDALVRDRARGLLAGRWSPKWAKVRNQKPRPEKLPPRKSGGHTSVHKLLQPPTRTY
jgi:hypothetical protein